MNTKNILIIDNNEEFLTNAINTLSLDRDIQEVVWSFTIDDIQNKIESYNPGIIILDLGIEGAEKVQHLIKDSYQPPIVLVTSFIENKDYLELSKEIGADGFCLKENFPTAFSQLKAYLDKGMSALFNDDTFSLN